MMIFGMTELESHREDCPWVERFNNRHPKNHKFFIEFGDALAPRSGGTWHIGVAVLGDILDANHILVYLCMPEWGGSSPALEIVVGNDNGDPFLLWGSTSHRYPVSSFGFDQSPSLVAGVKCVAKSNSEIDLLGKNSSEFGGSLLMPDIRSLVGLFLAKSGIFPFIEGKFFDPNTGLHDLVVLSQLFLFAERLGNDFYHAIVASPRCILTGSQIWQMAMQYALSVHSRQEIGIEGVLGLQSQVYWGNGPLFQKGMLALYMDGHPTPETVLPSVN